MPHAVIPQSESAESSCGRAGAISSRERRELEQGERLYGAGPATPKTRKGRPQPTALAAQASSADNPNDPNYKAKTPNAARRRSQQARAQPERLETGGAAGSVRSSEEWGGMPSSPLTPPPPSKATDMPHEAAAPNPADEAAAPDPLDEAAPPNDEAAAPAMAKAAAESRGGGGLLDKTTAWLADVLSWAGRQRPTFFQAVVLKFLGCIFVIYALLLFFGWVTSTWFYIAARKQTEAQAAQLEALRQPVEKIGAEATRGVSSSLGLVKNVVTNLPLLALIGFVVLCGQPIYNRLF